MCVLFRDQRSFVRSAALHNGWFDEVAEDPKSDAEVGETGVLVDLVVHGADSKAQAVDVRRSRPPASRRRTAGRRSAPWARDYRQRYRPGRGLASAGRRCLTFGSYSPRSRFLC